MLLDSDAVREVPKEDDCAYYIDCVILCECFFVISGVSNLLSPMAIVEGLLVYNKHFKVIHNKNKQTFQAT